MNEELLRTYSREVYSCDDTSLTLEQLIESHRCLRNMHLEVREERMKILNGACELGREQGYDEVTRGKYIAVEELRKMTVSELVEFLY